MIIWSIKILSNIRHAIAGRKYPHQLAGAVAIGALLGIIPHGNVLALLVLIVLLSLKINHSMAALTTIGTTFAATKLDPYSHDVGSYILTHPTLGPKMASFWKLPLAPWTDLNNTVVMGSFVIGVAALLPIFLITYPVFRFFKPQEDELAEGHRRDLVSDEALNAEEDAVVLVDPLHPAVTKPRRAEQLSPGETSVADAALSTALRIDESHHDSEMSESREATSPNVTVETRIDVIRMKDHVESGDPISTMSSADLGEESTDQQPMDEALRYLLRQLRTSQQKDAA